MLFTQNKHNFLDFTEGESEYQERFSIGHRQCAAVKESHAPFKHRRLQTRIRQWPRWGR
ncbi:MAG: hypothetical protein JSS01_14790 [Proteobacteria bacterium]|nr:hypothetical protein [Pseudomonadota bacterium]